MGFFGNITNSSQVFVFASFSFSEMLTRTLCKWHQGGYVSYVTPVTQLRYVDVDYFDISFPTKKWTVRGICFSPENGQTRISKFGDESKSCISNNVVKAIKTKNINYQTIPQLQRIQ